MEPVTLEKAVEEVGYLRQEQPDYDKELHAILKAFAWCETKRLRKAIKDALTDEGKGCCLQEGCPGFMKYEPIGEGDPWECTVCESRLKARPALHNILANALFDEDER